MKTKNPTFSELARNNPSGLVAHASAGLAKASGMSYAKYTKCAKKQGWPVVTKEQYLKL